MAFAKRVFVDPAFFCFIWIAVVIVVVTNASSGVAHLAPLESTGETQEVRVINILAERFFFAPSRLSIKAGETVELRIRSADTDHGFRIRKAGINTVIPKRGKGQARVRFRADKRGLYIFECSKACGAGHSMMRGRIIVE